MPTETKTHRILRLILFLSNSYPKSKEECIEFLDIKSSAFYNYCNLLKDIQFDLRQKDGSYWIDYKEKDSHLLGSLLHFSEEEGYLLSNSIDLLDEKTGCAKGLKQKLLSFLNQDKAIEAYVAKEKPAIVQRLRKALQNKKQILLIHYSSGNSLTVKNRLVEPFEFKDDFKLLWAYDTEIQKNRQFKVCRIEDVSETPFSWEFERKHRSLPVDVFRNTGALDKRVELQLNLRARNLLSEEYPLSLKYITAHGRNQFLFNAPVAKYEGPARFVLGMAEDVKPLGDDGFIRFIKEKIKKANIFFNPQNVE